MTFKKVMVCIVCIAVLVSLFLFNLWALDVIEKREESKRYIHLSFDDTITLFQDLTENQYASAFEHPLLSYLKQKHEQYGITVSFYCFYRNDEFSLAQCTDAYAKEFRENASWLKFGFHDIDGTANYSNSDAATAQSDYNATVNQLIRITGDRECLDIVPRLQNFAGSLEAVTGILWYNVDNGIRGLLSADDERLSYYLNEEMSFTLSNSDYIKDPSTGVTFVPTDIRLENTDAPYEDLSVLFADTNHGQVIEVFTHEWGVDATMIDKINQVVEFAYEHGLQWAFAQDCLI